MIVSTNIYNFLRVYNFYKTKFIVFLMNHKAKEHVYLKNELQWINSY